MQVVSPGPRRCCLMRTCRASGAVRGRLSIGRPSRAICPFPSFFPAASRRKTWDARSAKCGPGPWMCRAAWKRAAGSRIRRRSSNSFGACDLKMQGNPPEWAEYSLPDAQGHFGQYGGTFVAETLRAALDELTVAYSRCREDPAFQAELAGELEHYVGRPSPVYHARRLSESLGGAQIYLKREDLNHTGAHKVNNTVGQALLARSMGKPRVIAETGAGQHGVATATVAARYGMECVVYMGTEDVKRQAQNVYRMKLLGATVVPVESGSKTLKDALNEAMRDWVTNVDSTFYILGTVAGPHPYPMLVRDFQCVIGEECLEQMPELAGRQPDALIACVGGGSNAMGIFYPYIKHAKTRLIGVEAAGEGLATGKHAASLCAGKPGVLHGNRTYLLQDANGQITETHSVSAGLDYPGVGPEHAWLKDQHRAEYVAITDDEALKAFSELCRFEGIIPALESAHAVAYAVKIAPSMPKDKALLVNLSGRGDKDMQTVADRMGIKL